MILEHSRNDTICGHGLGLRVYVLKVLEWGLDRRILFKSVIREVGGEGGVNK
jgi:hypothetical protein